MQLNKRWFLNNPTARVMAILLHSQWNNVKRAFVLLYDKLHDRLVVLQCLLQLAVVWMCEAAAPPVTGRQRRGLRRRSLDRWNQNTTREPPNNPDRWFFLGQISWG